VRRDPLNRCQVNDHQITRHSTEIDVKISKALDPLCLSFQLIEPFWKCAEVSEEASVP
jgi:hypothetical protein